MDLTSPDGAVRGQVARVILNYVSGRRYPGLIAFGRNDPRGYLNQDLHDQLLGAVGYGGPIVPVGPPVILVQPASVVVPLHGTAIIWVSATGAPPLSYQWYNESGIMAGETGSSVVFTDVVSEHTVHVQITNAEGSVTSNEANVYVRTVTMEVLTNIDETLVFHPYTTGLLRAVSTTNLTERPAEASLWLDGALCSCVIERDRTIPGHRFSFIIGSQIQFSSAHAIITYRI